MKVTDMDNTDNKPKAKRGFAAMSPETRRKITSMGGKASGGNFKNDPKRASQVAKRRHALQRRRLDESKEESN